jgi:hypothetical protein
MDMQLHSVANGGGGSRLPRDYVRMKKTRQTQSTA